MEQRKTPLFFYFLLAFLCYEMLGWAQWQNKRELLLKKKISLKYFHQPGRQNKWQHPDASIRQNLIFVTASTGLWLSQTLWLVENLSGVKKRFFFPILLWEPEGSRAEGNGDVVSRNPLEQKWLQWQHFWRHKTATRVLKVGKKKPDAESREKLGDPNSLDKSSTARDRIFLVRAGNGISWPTACPKLIILLCVLD